jgi:hypothetical protein
MAGLSTAVSVAERNLQMAERISATPVSYPFSFVVAGDSGAWPDPTADAIFSALVRQAAARQPVFFANLGDFAGPGTAERHRHYLELVEPVACPNVCVIGNHDLDDPGGGAAWAEVHGPTNFSFAYGHTRFIAIDAAPSGPDGPGEEALGFLAGALAAATEPHRVVLMHCPPAFDGRFTPHPEWGFTAREDDFLSLIRTHGVGLVCCAHALLFDQLDRDGTRFVVSGGGGTALCSHYRGVCAPGDGPPEDRGALFHAVELTVSEGGAISGRVLQAFGGVRFTF